MTCKDRIYNQDRLIWLLLGYLMFLGSISSGLIAFLSGDVVFIHGFYAFPVLSSVGDSKDARQIFMPEEKKTNDCVDRV